MDRHRAAAWLRIAAAPLLVAAILWWAEPRRVIDEVAGAAPVWLLAGLAASTLANVVSALRWGALARWLGHRVGVPALVGIYFRAVAINALLPGAIVGGDLYRAVSLNRRGQPALEAGLSVLLDRLSGLWMLVVLGTLAAAWGLADGRSPVPVPPAIQAAGAGLLAGAAVVMLVAPVVGWPLVRAIATAPGAGAGWRARAATIAARPGAWRQYLLQAAASLAVQLLSVGAFALGGRSLGIDLPFWAWAAAAVPVFLMATLPVSFGGWGTREAAAVVALAAFGVPAAPAVGASVLYGIFALAQALAGGLLLAARAGEPPAPSKGGPVHARRR